MRWTIKPNLPSAAKIKYLAQALNVVADFVATLLVQRGIEKPNKPKIFFFSPIA
jgi:hypothetical protein